MRILIRDNKKTVLNLWVPSGPRLIGFILGFVRTDEGHKLDLETRKKIVTTYRKIRQYHKNLVIADITSQDGSKVFIKL